MSEVLGVSSSGFYDWQRGGPSSRATANAALGELIESIHVESKKRGLRGCEV